MKKDERRMEALRDALFYLTGLRPPREWWEAWERVSDPFNPLCRLVKEGLSGPLRDVLLGMDRALRSLFVDEWPSPRASEVWVERREGVLREWGALRERAVALLKREIEKGGGR